MNESSNQTVTFTRVSNFIYTKNDLLPFGSTDKYN